MQTGEEQHSDASGRTRPAGELAATSQRSLMIDVVKGMAILLVTFGHTSQGIMHRHPWAHGNRLDEYIYSFHMPAFFFVSGVFIASSLDKRGLQRFLRNKVATILYPFWLFALILPWMPYLLHSFVNSPRLLVGDILLNLVTGNVEWFLPALFLATVVAALLRRVPAWITFPVAWLVSFFWHPLGVAALDRGMTLLPFLLAGMLVGPRVGVVQKLPSLVCLAVASVLGVVIYCATPIGVQPIYWGFVPVGLLGTLMLLLLARALGAGAGARFFAWLGLASLAIFLLSPFGQGAGRALLDRAHVENVAAHLAVGTALATLVPAWIYQHRERLRVAWMFRWPRGR